MNYNKFSQAIETVINEFDYDKIDETLESLSRYLLGHVTPELKIDGVRIWKRSNNSFSLLKRYGKVGKAQIGFKVRAHYPPIKELMSNEEGYILKNLNDHGINKNLENRLGVENFAAFRIGDRADYLDSINLPENLDHHKDREIKRLLKTLTKTINSRINDTKFRGILEDASKLQKSVLPHEQPSFEGYDIYFLSKQAEKAGGDYVNFIDLGGKLAIAIGDASGHGLPAALQAMATHISFRTAIKLGYAEEIQKVVSTLNTIVHHNRIQEQFITFFYGTLDKDGKLDYSNAGHNPPILLDHSKDSFKEVDAGGLPLGLFTGFEYDKAQVKLKKGDILVMYTDGITELINRKGKIFGVQRLKDLVIKNKNNKSKELTEIVLEEIAKFSRKVNLEDDMTLAVIKRI